MVSTFQLTRSIGITDTPKPQIALATEGRLMRLVGCDGTILASGLGAEVNKIVVGDPADDG